MFLTFPNTYVSKISSSSLRNICMELESIKEEVLQREVHYNSLLEKCTDKCVSEGLVLRSAATLGVCRITGCMGLC